jgi:hypothetical protein
MGLDLASGFPGGGGGGGGGGGCGVSGAADGTGLISGNRGALFTGNPPVRAGGEMSNCGAISFGRCGCFGSSFGGCNCSNGFTIPTVPAMAPAAATGCCEGSEGCCKASVGKMQLGDGSLGGHWEGATLGGHWEGATFFFVGGEPNLHSNLIGGRGGN